VKKFSILPFATFALLSAMLALVNSCALFQLSSTTTPETQTTAPSPKPTDGASITQQMEAMERSLASPLLHGIPDESIAYLEKIGRAFLLHDGEYLRAQGEPYYEKTVRPQVNDVHYLELLYRIEGGDFMLDDVTGFSYTGYDETGPVLEVSGNMRLKNAKSCKFTIVLLWRLKTQKIQGEYP
jgi:hypothetical protein